MNQNDSLEQTHQTLVEHLVELRFRLVRSAWAILIGMVACYNFTTDIFDIIRKPIAPYLPTGGLIFNAPADKFIAHLKIAFFGGLILSCPFWIYQIWKFVSPGLYTKEKKYTLDYSPSNKEIQYDCRICAKSCSFTNNISRWNSSSFGFSEPL
jgi:sec-independent protein translocase protein TatC